MNSVKQKVSNCQGLSKKGSKIGSRAAEGPCGLELSRGVGESRASGHTGMEVGESSPTPLGGSPHSKPKASYIRKVALRSYRLKKSACYLDYMQYYFSSEYLPYSLEGKYGLGFTYEYATTRLGGCQHTWARERKGEDIRFRGIGCGERVYCPLCGSYVQITLAREASESMLLAQDACEVGGVKLESHGLRVVLPLYKLESKRIDALLFAGKVTEWQREVNKIFRLAASLIKAWFGRDTGFVLSLEYTGESAPTEPHYHINVYVFPVELLRGKDSLGYVPLKHWFTDAELEACRDAWRDTQNEAYGLSLVEGDIKITYIGKKASLYHWLRYLYKHPLSDIWRGWDNYNSERQVLTYTYSKREGKERKRVTLEIPAAELAKAYQRLDMVPKHFKRVRWCGVFSDGQKGRTMRLLGLVKQEVEGDGDDGEWVSDGYFGLVSLERDGGVVLEDRDTGARFKVVAALVNYKPKGVRVGRRIVWSEPGDSRDPPGEF